MDEEIIYHDLAYTEGWDAATVHMEKELASLRLLVQNYEIRLRMQQAELQQHRLKGI